MTDRETITAPKYTLGETVNGYLLRAGNINRKYYPKYFRIAQDIYEELYANIMNTTINRYSEVFPAGPGDKYPYIKRPEGMARFFGVSVTNKHNELIQVYQNDKLNVFTKPTIQKKCGCSTTDLCDCIDNLQVVLTEKFVVQGTTYYEKTWVKCCANGDVLQYSETPVLVGNTEEVQVVVEYKNLGRLATKNCGCPLETEENNDLIFNKCGCFLSAKPRCCKVWYDKSRIDCTGEYKWSQCQTKIYLKNVKDDDGFAIIHFQLDPVNCASEILIDSFARRPIWFGMDFESNVFNPRSNKGDMREAERRYTKAVNTYFSYLNPINPDRFFNIPTAEIKL